MKIKVPKENILEAVNKVKSVIALKSALPILSHILMEAKDGQVKLVATDLKVSIEYTLDCDVIEPGEMTVSAMRIANILSELPNEVITIELTQSREVFLKSEKVVTDTQLFSMSVDEFPPIRRFENIEPLVLNQGLMKDMVSKTSFAICTDQARHNLTGILFELTENYITTVATDGRRMSMYQRRHEEMHRNDVRVIIPGKMVNELERLLGSEGDVYIYLDETQAGFKFGNIYMVTSIIEGSFPNYEMVIPKKLDKEIYASTTRLLEAVRRTRTMTNDKFNSVRFLIDNGILTLKVSTPEVGEYEEEMPIEYDGERIEIAFNPDYVIDILKHIETEKVCLQLKDYTSPGKFVPEYKENEDSEENEEAESIATEKNTYINVVMPIRV